MKSVFMKIWRNLQSIWDQAPLHLSWSYLWGANEKVDKLHLIAVLNAYPELQQRSLPIRILRVFMIGAILLVWPLKAIILIFSMSSQYGAWVKQNTGKSIFRQVIEQLHLAFIHSVSPLTYYSYQFYRDERRKKVKEYIYGNEKTILFNYLNREADISLIDDKLLFHDLCIKYDLPTCPILSTFVDGKLNFYGDNTSFPPERDIIIKPIGGNRGVGITRWDYDGQDHYTESSGALKLSSEELINYLEQQSRQAGLLVQPRLHTHTQLSGFTNGALATVRILTACHNNQVEYFYSMFKMPRGSSIIDNLISGGIACGLEPESGRLGAAYSINPVSEPIHIHPDTGQQFYGQTLPLWDEAKALACKAHETFLKDFIFLGWDVALTDNGLLLIETNDDWPVDIVQKLYSMPLGQTKFVDICLARLQDIRGY